MRDDDNKRKQLAKHDSHALSAGSILNQALQNLSEEQKQELLGIAAEEAIKLEVERTRSYEREVAARKLTEDHIEANRALNTGKFLSGHRITDEMQTSVGTRRIDSRQGVACFVATACFGDTNAPEVVSLRCFRDSVLSKSTLGRGFIGWYYANGPILAEYTKKSTLLRYIGRSFVLFLLLILNVFFKQKCKCFSLVKSNRSNS